MNITMMRSKLGERSTVTICYVNEAYQCFLLEDKVREPKFGRPIDPVKLVEWVNVWKKAGDTAIPTGKFKIEITESPRFSKVYAAKLGLPDGSVKVFTPEFRNVPAYSGVRFHPGVKHEDSEGCPLPGTAQTVEPDGDFGVAESKIAYSALFARINTALRVGEEVWCEVRNP